MFKQISTGLSKGTQTPETPAESDTKNKMWMYIALGVVAVGGVALLARRR
jgi:hypothetical protein